MENLSSTNTTKSTTTTTQGVHMENTTPSTTNLNHTTITNKESSMKIFKWFSTQSNGTSVEESIRRINAMEEKKRKAHINIHDLSAKNAYDPTNAGTAPQPKMGSPKPKPFPHQD